MKRSRLVPILASLCLALLVPGVQAQEGLASLIPNLFNRDIFLFETPVFDHSTHFIDEGERLRAAGDAINQALVSQLATFPLASPSGGFTFEYDPSLGTFTRASDSFGSLFAERAVTNGRGKWSFGLSYQSAEWDSIDGLDFSGEDLSFQLQHEDTNLDEGPIDFFFEGDVIEATTRLDLESETTTLYFSYGISDRFDVALAVPYVSVDLRATAELDIERIATGSGSTIHSWDATGRTREVFSESGSESGIGDVLVRGKWHFSGSGARGWSAALDLRLPTGDDEELLGTGHTQAKLYLIGSTEWGSFSPHVNLGYTFSSGSSDVIQDLPDEINYTLGFDWAALPRLTVSADFVGRTLLDATRLRRVQDEFRYCPQRGAGPFCAPDAVATTLRPNLDPYVDDLDSWLGALGVRFNPVGNLLVSVNGLWFLNDDEGLVDEDVIPVVALEYAF